MKPTALLAPVALFVACSNSVGPVTEDQLVGLWLVQKSESDYPYMDLGSSLVPGNYLQFFSGPVSNDRIRWGTGPDALSGDMIDWGCRERRRELYPDSVDEDFRCNSEWDLLSNNSLILTSYGWGPLGSAKSPDSSFGDSVLLGRSSVQSGSAPRFFCNKRLH